MSINFPLLLVIAVAVCGALALFDLIFLAPRRRAAISTYHGQVSEPDEAVVERLNKEPLLVEYGKSFFPVLAIVLVLGTMTAVVSVSLWISQGLYSGALLGYPVILIVAGMVSRLRLFVALLLFMLASVALITCAALFGWQHFVPQPMGLGRMVNVSCSTTNKPISSTISSR